MDASSILEHIYTRKAFKTVGSRNQFVRVDSRDLLPPPTHWVFVLTKKPIVIDRCSVLLWIQKTHLPIVSCSAVLVIRGRDSPGIHFETVLQSYTKRTFTKYRQDEDAQFQLQKDLDRVYHPVPIRCDIRIHNVPQDPANGIAEGECEQGAAVVDVVF